MATSTNGEQQNMKVAVRVRPNNQKELESNQVSIVKVIDIETIVFDPEEDLDEFFFQGIKQTHRDITKKTHKKLSMEFDQVFHPLATNEEVFEECTKPLVRSLMDGYNCSVFVYGATGAGKTYTMLGSNNSPGISFLTIEELFKQIDSLENTRKFDIGISYLEVYNEQVMNLLTKSGPLKLREDFNGVVVSGLHLKPIYNASELLNLLELGNTNRTQHPTDANSESSRSHAIFQVHIRMTDKKTGQKQTVKLSMIDLAGSERASSTKGIGLRFKEGASINKSLLALGNCINKLADGLKHIPYRDSNLTRILKDSLGGNCQTLMIANVSPSSLTYEDTYNTLKYATRAKKIRSTIRQNIIKTNMPKEYYVKKVCDQINENQQLKSTIFALEAQIKSSTGLKPSKSYNETELKVWYDKIDNVCVSLIKSQEKYLTLQSKEKICKLKTKLKSYAEEGKKILILDGLKLNEELARFHATIERLEKQVTSQQNEIKHWSECYNENLMELAKLKNEIFKENHLCSILEMYLSARESKIETLKQKLKLSHARKINSLYNVDFQHLRSINSQSLEVIQRNYFLFRAHKLIDTEFQEKLDKLSKLCNGHGIKFFGENNTSADDNFELSSLNKENDENYLEIDQINCGTLTNKKKLIECDNDDLNTPKKRFRNLFNSDKPCDSDELGLDFIKPDEPKFKNSNKFINNEIIGGLNSTFEVKTSNSSATVLENILSEDNIRSTNRIALNKALQKTRNVADVVKKITTNKILSPGRKRKIMRSALGRENQNGIVRINKTASLRIKKK